MGWGIRFGVVVLFEVGTCVCGCGVCGAWLKSGYLSQAQGGMFFKRRLIKNKKLNLPLWSGSAF
jgi:hypothetical protein